ncbi:phosphatidylglycerol lysyltransferase domain-containing protein [uncultured Desulfovibrio sp.]|uniref:DUF2156 domain-containing protein n=1 Tax=uncultured Desulfovibrio sp. TaxID=167968 RepID=UPI00263A88EC|nr:phosphatidylglycerol lysyltransferase domain-containing protein [uncultured Desulfovibrio sp.]
MDRNFIPVNLRDADAYYELWQATPRRSLDYTLANLWGWQEFYGLEWQFADRLCWIRQTRPEPRFWAPIGDWNAVNWRPLLPAAGGTTGLEFIRVPEALVHIWRKELPDLVETGEERGQWEYLYRQEELATLAGNRFHKKRNHYNSFIKAYGEPDYRGVTDAMVEDVLGVQDDWCQWHECDNSPSLLAENEAINRVLTRWDAFRGLTGASLYVDGRMIAFSVGERLDDESLGVHFEKGLSGYKGVYQAMNCEFARHAGAGLRWINRAQDLDEEGLRQAKMTYLPADFLRKYRVRVRPA